MKKKKKKKKFKVTVVEDKGSEELESLDFYP